MKKSLRIAAYDYKRIMLNPITLICLVVLLASTLIIGFIMKPQTTPEYSASISGETTKQIYENFFGTKDIDRKENLDLILNEAKAYLSIQNQEVSLDQSEFKQINIKFQEIKDEVKKYGELGTSAYLSDISPFKNATTKLNNFVERFAGLSDLETDVIFTQAQFEELTAISTYFKNLSTSTKSNAQILSDLYKNISTIDDLNHVATNVYTWECDPAVLEALQGNCIETAEKKLVKIVAEMQKLNNEVIAGDIDHVQDMHNLVTNYKLTCESAKFEIETEFKILLEKRFDNLKGLYHFEEISIENSRLALTKAEYFLNDDGLYYTQYQTALNFNTASYQVTIYDYTYMIISIVGFLTILFGIFCAYKLFGRDRKNGKMDTILAQDVTFNQAFMGKTLAITFITSTILLAFTVLSLLWGLLLYTTLPNPILAVFNLTSVYTIHPILFLLIKVIGIQLQAIFYSTLTLFLMNLSRKFEIMFVVSLLIFAAATVCNIFLNGSFVYCLFPFIHSDITSFIGGATMETGFLKTALYTSGNFFISIAYYFVFVILLFSFTKQIFKKN